MNRALASLVVVGMCLFAVTGCKEDKKLKVTGIYPSQGDYLGGQIVRVTGNRFQKDGVRSVKVYFGSAQAQVLRFNGDDELIVQAPGGKPNDIVDVKFYFEPGGVLTVTKAFKFIEEGQSDIDDLNIKK